MIRHGRAARFVASALGAAVALAGCAELGPPGKSGLRDELARGRGFAVISASPERAVFEARGQRVAVEPPRGYCLDEKSVEVTRHAVVALVADCMHSHELALTNGSGASHAADVKLPRSFAGILTVSVSGEPAFGDGTVPLDAFEATLASDVGRTLLRRGNGSPPGRVISTRRIGGALYVLVEETARSGVPFFAPRFWRAFADIAGRLVLVTVSGFSDRPIAGDVMLAFLAGQVAALRAANGLSPDSEEIRIAGSLESSLGSVASVTPDLVTGSVKGSAHIADAANPVRSPLPPRRKSSGGRTAGGGAAVAGAPAHAPVAPERPG